MTAVTEILEHCKKLISEGNQIDTQGLVHWIEDTLLEMEKQQSIELIKQTVMFMAASHLDEDIANMSYEDVYKTYYNETFKNTKE
jgi:hypothetical protein